MSRKEIFDRVVEICRDVFENEAVMITEDSTADDIEEWDSITFLDLISDIEEEFKIAFTLEEMSGFKTIGMIVDVIMSK